MRGKTRTELGQLLGRSLCHWQAGLVLLSLIRVLAWALVFLLLYFILDFFLALGSRTRGVLDAILLAFLAIALAVRWIRIAALAPRDMALRADRLLGNHRHTVLSAFELERWLETQTAPEPELKAYLMTRAIGRAAEEVRRLRRRDGLPREELRRGVRVLLVCFSVAVLSLAVNRTASRIILARIFRPGRDIPPYSRYTFHVTPETLVVLYGSDLAVQAEIGGRDIGGEVGFLTRTEGRVHRAACFQESATRFAQRLEGVVAPVEFCFTVGRARSLWHKVDVLFEPRIAAAEVLLTPPAYSGRPARRFYLGSEDLAGLKGSRIEMTLTSNRPLLDGRVQLRPGNGGETAPAVVGEKTGEYTVRFAWTINEPATAEITVRDIRGTQNAMPFKVVQRVLPDEPPAVVLSEPPPFSLATPGIVVPIRGQADDDLGLLQVDVARALVGYRDRIQPVGPPEPVARFEYEGELVLAQLGVEAGQVLEVYLEAMDGNPSLTGVSVSEVARVQIISEEEYALMLRVRISAEEFVARYTVLQQEFSDLQKALKELSDQLGQGEPDPEKVEQAREKARRSAERAAELFADIARDFPAYEMEQRLQEAAGGMSERMRQTEALLGASRPPYEGLKEQVDAILKEYSADQDRLDEQIRDAEEAALLAEIMESAALYTRLVNEQESLVRRLSRFEGGSRQQDVRLLAEMERRQAEIREQLSGLLEQIDRQAGQLRIDYLQLTSDMEEFVEKAGALLIVTIMERAELMARNEDGPETLRQARLALEKMQELVGQGEGSCFGGLCQGQLKFDVRQNMRSTLEQMLAAITMRICSGLGMVPGEGRGGGPGGAGLFGGDSSDGYWMGGQSALNIQVYGPERRAFRSATDGGSGFGRGKGPGEHRIGERDTDRVAPPTSGPVAADSMPLENVPESYREAVKKYFSTGEP
ncbi:MAG: hypothetical protein KKC51_07860 [Verrucomicrobia bacterium]|nr:hypothetical protein [Verrucomicrobiota bacterium]